MLWYNKYIYTKTGVRGLTVWLGRDTLTYLLILTYAITAHFLGKVKYKSILYEIDLSP